MYCGRQLRIGDSEWSDSFTKEHVRPRGLQYDVVPDQFKLPTYPACRLCNHARCRTPFVIAIKILSNAQKIFPDAYPVQSIEYKIMRAELRKQLLRKSNVLIGSFKDLKNP